MALLLFDCDGTLVDSQHMIVASMQQAFHVNNMQAPTREQTLAIVGLSLPEAMARLTNKAHDKLINDFKATYNSLRAKTIAEPLYDGALSCLQHFYKQGVMLGVATGKSRRGVDLLVRDYDLQGYFSTIQTADNAPSKPDPAMIRQAANETGKSIDQIIMIGDTSYDMEMARNAGAYAIGVTWGYHHRAILKQAGAHLIVDDYNVLTEAIKARIG